MINSREHRHGGLPQVDQKRLGIDDSPILDFSVNLNPFGPPWLIKERWSELFETIENYPSVKGEGINHFYEKKYGLSSRNILGGNGSTELIYMIPRVLKLKQVAIVTPSYHDYERASRLFGSEVIKHPLSGQDGFAFENIDMLMNTIQDSDAIWLGRPNNPTGSLMPKEIVLDLAKRFPDKWFIIDEAFIQFVENWKEESLLFEKVMKNIFVIHSLTKFYALAGLRLAGLFGDEKLISQIKKKKEPWTVNGIAEKVALFLTKCENYEEKTCLFVNREKNRVFERLKEINGITPFTPKVNFILCQWKGTANLDDLIRHLLLNGIYIRDCRNFEGLEEGFFRIGLKEKKENDRLISVLRSV